MPSSRPVTSMPQSSLRPCAVFSKLAFSPSAVKLSGTRYLFLAISVKEWRGLNICSHDYISLVTYLILCITYPPITIIQLHWFIPAIWFGKRWTGAYIFVQQPNGAWTWSTWSRCTASSFDLHETGALHLLLIYMKQVHCVFFWSTWNRCTASSFDLHEAGVLRLLLICADSLSTSAAPAKTENWNVVQVFVGHTYELTSWWPWQTCCLNHVYTQSGILVFQHSMLQNGSISNYFDILCQQSWITFLSNLY